MAVDSSRFLDSYPDVLTPDEARVVLGIGRNTLYKLLKEEKIKSIRIGTKHRIPKKELESFISGC